MPIPAEAAARLWADLGGRPRLFTIAADRPFVDALADGLSGPGAPGELVDMLVLVPTRRAVRELTQAFLRRSAGQALLLPRIRPIGDVDEDELSLQGVPDALSVPPAPSPHARRFLLARLVGAWWRAQGKPPDPGAALAHAEALALLIDEMATEGADWRDLAGLVPDALAVHWQDTLRFLDIAFEHWPAMLAERGQIDAAARRDRLLGALAAGWRARPPAHPVVVAGSTGSIPATAALIGVVARLPLGAVVLPGLDQSAPGAAWDRIDANHPQWGLKSLLRALGADRGEVEAWPGPPPAPAAAARMALLSHAMEPAAATAGWAALRPSLDIGGALRGLARIDAPDAAAEGRAIALLLREALEVPGATARLVTPDRALARRVTAELRRWGIEVDDSAGRPLGRTPPGALLRLVLDACREELAPLSLLALLKHPLAGLGLDPAACRRAARRLERRLLRGLRPPPGIAGLRARAATDEDAAPQLALIGRIEAALGGLLALAAGEHPLDDFLAAHVAAAEAVAATDRESGAERLWRGDAGEAAAGLLADLRAAAGEAEALDLAGYAGLFRDACLRLAVRPAWGRHPRLAVLGPQEARLGGGDLVVLGGLNEGTWPAPPPDDPWLSRPMREALGLPSPDRRIGQAAHDFAMLAAAPRVVLTRARKVDNTPTVPSRWLQRLDALIGSRADWHDDRPLAWAEVLDPPEGAPRPEPAPRPPVGLRPAELYVSDIETLIRDPYALYARKILRLRKLAPIDEDPTFALRGTIIHEALDGFVREHGAALPPDALDRLLAYGRVSFARLDHQPALRAILWPRFVAIARWFLEAEAERRPGVLPVAVEVGGKLEVPVPGLERPFTLKARADRIDRTAGGGLIVIDYKTGTVPRAQELESGAKPQLPLEAAIALHGGFDGVAAAPIERLEFWQIKGGEPPGRILPVEGDIAAMADRVLADLARLVGRYARPETPYLAQPHAALEGWGDYDHLARPGEWGGEGRAG